MAKYTPPMTTTRQRNPISSCLQFFLDSSFSAAWSCPGSSLLPSTFATIKMQKINEAKMARVKANKIVFMGNTLEDFIDGHGILLAERFHLVGERKVLCGSFLL